jgi:hypothetical protein
MDEHSNISLLCECETVLPTVNEENMLGVSVIDCWASYVDLIVGKQQEEGTIDILQTFITYACHWRFLQWSDQGGIDC